MPRKIEWHLLRVNWYEEIAVAGLLEDRVIRDYKSNRPAMLVARQDYLGFYCYYESGDKDKALELILFLIEAWVHGAEESVKAMREKFDGITKQLKETINGKDE